MSGRVLNHAQFAAQVNAGGASRHLQSMAEGPSSGYYVSLPKSAGFEHVHDRPVTPVDAAFHRSRSIQALGTTPWANARELYQGGWPSGKTYLDVSERETHFGTALKKGYRHQQHAIYDAGRGADVHMSNSPSMQEGPQSLRTFHDRRADAPGIKGTYRIQADASKKHGWKYV